MPQHDSQLPAKPLERSRFIDPTPHRQLGQRDSVKPQRGGSGTGCEPILLPGYEAETTRQILIAWTLALGLGLVLLLASLF